MLYEVGDDPRPTVVPLLSCGPRGDEARALLSPSACLTWTVDADSHFDAMTLYYEHMGWGTHTTDQESGTAARTLSMAGSSARI